MLYCICLPVTSRKPHLHRNEVSLLVNCARITERERPVERGFSDRPPEIDDLEAAREQRGDVVGGQVPRDAGGGGFGRLVDVHLGDGLAFLWGIFELAWAAAVSSEYCDCTATLA